MHTLNYTLDQNILDADGRYLDSQELQPLEQYVQSYATRLDTYQQLRDHSEKLVLMALRKLATTYPELVQQHGGRCKYDMSEVLRYIAIAILRDDETFFKDQMMVWLDTILLAHRRQAQCGQAYRNLQEAIATSLTPAAMNLIRPYLDVITQSLQSHA
ncbi:MAG: phycobilisome protein [Leptolyngbyaceae cyanobacterium bins.349]|nr:phycobilisome protein [Leptolyngbyaceae cyanobacterium bins.349]